MSGKDWVLSGAFFPSAASGEGEEVRGWLRCLRAGAAQELERVTFTPLLLAERLAPRDLLVPEALAAKALVLAEAAGGVVRRLRARNAGTVPVLILEGDVVLGGKQNRMIVRTVLLPAGKEVELPVGCVEQGRWDAGRDPFDMAPSKAETTLRATSWTESSRSPTRDVDQGRLWTDVHQRLREYGVHSPSSSYAGALDRLAQETRKVVERLAPVEGQVGVVVSRGGRMIGAELTGHPEVWSHLATRSLPPLVRAGLQAVPGSAGVRSAEELVATIADAPLSLSAGLAAGQDVELASPAFAGHGLWADAAMRHLAVIGR